MRDIARSESAYLRAFKCEKSHRVSIVADKLNFKRGAITMDKNCGAHIAGL